MQKMSKSQTKINRAKINCASVADLQQVVADIIKLAKQQGASAVEAAASTDVGLSVTVRMAKVENIEFNRDKSIAITVYKGKRKGSASSTDISSQAIHDVVQAACDIAAYTEEDPYAGLADPELMARQIPDLQLFHPADLTPECAVEIAQQCEQAAFAVDPRLTNADGTTMYSNVHYGAYGNSLAFLAGQPSTSYSLSCSMIAEQQQTKQRSYDYTTARDFNDLTASSQIGQQAANKTIARLGARKINTTQVPILFVAEVARSLVSSFIAAISGSNLYRKTSFLVDALQRQIFPKFMRIYEDPFILKALGSAAFDREGVATKCKDFVTAGVLQSYVLGSYSARKLGLQSTGNAGGVHNLTVCPGSDDFPALIKKLDKGLIVTELLGHGINLTTGDYSRGACGFWVEHGKIQYPVEEVTIAGNLAEMFTRVIAVGNDVDYRGNIRTGSWLIDTMMVAGN